MGKDPEGDGSRRDVPRKAPGDLRKIQEFLNTRRLREKTDDLAELQEAAAWLIDEGLLASGTKLDDPEHRRLLQLREGLRCLLGLKEHGVDETLELLQQALGPQRLRIRIEDDGALELDPVVVSDSNRILTGFMLILYQAQTPGEPLRLKICAEPTCRTAFHDKSRNRSARFCVPRCSNRFHAKKSRRRRND